MPKAPTASNSHCARAVSPVEVPPPPSTPLADANAELKNLPSLSRKADINDKHIRTILVSSLVTHQLIFSPIMTAIQFVCPDSMLVSPTKRMLLIGSQQ
jgi:hypothetical protein